MKRILLGVLLIVMILACSAHFGLRYLSFTRQLGFTPIISLLKADDVELPHKVILKLKY